MSLPSHLRRQRVYLIEVCPDCSRQPLTDDNGQLWCPDCNRTSGFDEIEVSQQDPQGTGLTPRETRFAMEQFSRWLMVRLEHEGNGERWKEDGHVLLSLMVDIQHSALLWRLLSGKEPLPQPPPLHEGQPDYDD